MQEAVSSHRQEGLKVLVRVKGQGNDGQPLGPWPLDIEQRSMKEVRTPCSVKSYQARPHVQNSGTASTDCFQAAVFVCFNHQFAPVFVLFVEYVDETSVSRSSSVVPERHRMLLCKGKEISCLLVL